ncbi:MAG: master DNA invertase Mpi family serine-type recombinase [Alphaproteobacteria bacterium]|nr:master DNA invertase Mpi family serine-type recombinase [Alphaproteobacteria bacterium]
MIYGYLRVSTDKQSIKNQEFEIKNFCKNEQIEISLWIKETISGTLDVEQRKLGRILKILKKGDILICSEISRLGRNLFQIMSILHICMQKGVQVWTIKDHYRLGSDIQSKVLAFAFSLSAEIERTLISQRTKEALARLKSSGKRLGRPTGSKNKKYILDGKAEIIQQMISNGLPKNQIAKKLSVSTKSIYNHLKEK